MSTGNFSSGSRLYWPPQRARGSKAPVGPRPAHSSIAPILQRWKLHRRRAPGLQSGHGSRLHPGPEAAWPPAQRHELAHIPGPQGSRAHSPPTPRLETRPQGSKEGSRESRKTKAAKGRHYPELREICPPKKMELEEDFQFVEMRTDPGQERNSTHNQRLQRGRFDNGM